VGIDLCESCGICCDGTLFNYVTLVDDDVPKLARYPQLKLKLRNEQATFDQGCVLHTGTGCSAYDDRPDTCSRYVCGVLRAVARDELTDDEALLVIKEAKALVDNVQEYVAFEAGMPIAVASWDSVPEGLTEEARLAWERTAHHMNKHFLRNGRVDSAPPLPPVLPTGPIDWAEPPLPPKVRATRASLFEKARKLTRLP